MDGNKQNELKRSVTFQIEIPSSDGIPQNIVDAFFQASAEAQLLELSLKEAIRKDVIEYGSTNDHKSFLEILERATLGNSKSIATGKAKSGKQKLISACIGFYDLMKCYWNCEDAGGNTLEHELRRAVEMRNRLAHSLIAEISRGKLQEQQAENLLVEARECFYILRKTVSCADFMSSKLGGIATDGTSTARSKVTKK